MDDSIDQMVRRYAPKKENDMKAYAKFLHEKTGGTKIIIGERY